MRRGLMLLFLAAGSAAAEDPLPGADPKVGGQLHETHCVACHIRLYGGDGSKIYTRKEPLIRTPKALLQRVAACNAQINAGLFPEEEAHVAAYVNERYYRFKLDCRKRSLHSELVNKSTARPDRGVACSFAPRLSI